MKKRTSAGPVRHLTVCAFAVGLALALGLGQSGAAEQRGEPGEGARGQGGGPGGTRTGELFAERSRAERSGAEGRDRHARAPGSRQLRAELRAGGPLDRRAGSLHAGEGVRHARVHHQGPPRSDRGAGVLHAQAPSRHGDLRRDGFEPHDRHQGQPVGDHPHGRDEGRMGPHRVDAELGLGEQCPQAARAGRPRTWRLPNARGCRSGSTIRSRAPTAESCCRKSKRRCRSSPRRRRATATAT